MKLLHRLRALFRKDGLDQELSDEMAFHLEKQIEQNVAAGMSAEEARFAALRKFAALIRRRKNAATPGACGSLTICSRTFASACGCWPRIPDLLPWRFFLWLLA